MDASGGGTLTGHQLITAQGQGDLGNRYRFSDAGNTTFHFDFDFVPFTFSQVLVDHVIGLGQAPNYILHTTTNTFNANGEVTANVSQSKAECR